MSTFVGVHGWAKGMAVRSTSFLDWHWVCKSSWRRNFGIFHQQHSLFHGIWCSYTLWTSGNNPVYAISCNCILYANTQHVPLCFIDATRLAGGACKSYKAWINSHQQPMWKHHPCRWSTDCLLALWIKVTHSYISYWTFICAYSSLFF